MDYQQNQRQAIIAIAAAEVGYKEGAANQSKFGAWYGLDHNPWCAMFVSWCAAQAGVSREVIPKFAYVPDGVRFYQRKNRWRSRLSGYRPQPGDLIFYGSNGSSGAHVGLVENVSGDFVITLEGNTGSGGNSAEGEGVYRRKRPLANGWIMGYGLPEYNESKEEAEMRYNQLSEIPTAYREAVAALMEAGIVKGKDQGLDLSEDMLRMLVWLQRLRALD